MSDRPHSDLEHQYAWDWFSYHAGQRLTAFNFFLVLFGAILVAYSQAAAHHLDALGAALGLFGLLVSVAFWAMDVRNTELVECGRVALDQLEKRLTVHIRADDRDRDHLGHVIYGPMTARIYSSLIRKMPKFTPRLYTHSFWLRNVLLIAGLISLAGAALAVIGFPGG